MLHACMHACMQNWDGYNTNLHFEKCGYTNNKMDYDIFPKWQNHQFFWCVEEQQIPKHPRIGWRKNTQESQMNLIVNRKQHYSDPTISLNPWKSHEVVGFIELDDGQIYRKPLYLGKNHGFRWRFSRKKPVHWWFLHHRTWKKSFTISRKIGMPGMSCLSSRCVTFSCPSWGTGKATLWRYDPLDSTG